ncbi:DUF6538 domain-containing protein [Sphingomonas sp. SAFR-052]|uniref:DUF6538 domain-containing protein n=1 Tax=Sphingomonas sp. SAFR-052 TaxID=3436867 RepID=UPI003F7FAA0F
MAATTTVLARYMWKRPGIDIWQLRKPVPADVQRAFGRKVVTRSLGSSDDRIATIAALAILGDLEEQWNALRSGTTIRPILPAALATAGDPPERVKLTVVRAAYEQVLGELEARDKAQFLSDRTAFDESSEHRRKMARELNREVRAGDLTRFIAVTDRLLANRGVVVDQGSSWFNDLVQRVATAVLDALGVAIRGDEGMLDPKPTTLVVKEALNLIEPAAAAKDIKFSDLAEAFMRQWLAGRSGAKETNTEPQKRATFRLFSGFFSDRPIRGVRPEDAATFFDTLRLLDPSWARSPAARLLSWQQLIERYGGRDRGLSDATLNRHLQVLQELWTWSKKRGHCEGENPFHGFHNRLRPGYNVAPYVAWEDTELRQLLEPTPKRSDLLEIILVGMFTGMRLDEIASLTWGQLQVAEECGVSIPYFQVVDAKTPAGNRKVPVHSDLSWLLSRARGADQDRVWPTFNEEGRAKKPGADAGREFSRFKAARGFSDRTKAFHSFRKNVTRMMERAGVPENDWAQIFGHERGFTYRVYNPDGLHMRRRAEIIALIEYPGIVVPHPAS